jgi:hypothetical protein
MEKHEVTLINSLRTFRIDIVVDERFNLAHGNRSITTGVLPSSIRCEVSVFKRAGVRPVRLVAHG